MNEDNMDLVAMATTAAKRGEEEEAESAEAGPYLPSSATARSWYPRRLQGTDCTA